MTKGHSHVETDKKNPPRISTVRQEHYGLELMYHHHSITLEVINEYSMGKPH